MYSNPPSGKDYAMLDVRPTIGDSKWFVHDRFGMFIHWGLYAQGARHEWLMNNESIPVEEYERRYFKRFNPDLYDPAVWAKAAAGAGMKYFVITTKHHEGFCLWDSKLTDYKAPNTAARRDLLKPMVQAFRKENMHVGFYHSLIDWHHPHFVLDRHIGPYRNHPDREKLNKGRDQKKYAAYLHGQVRELLTRYGKVDIMWFDFSYPKPDGSGKGHKDWESEKLLKLIRKLQPQILIDNRLDLPDGWDFLTPEQTQPPAWVQHKGQRVVWEACQTLCNSWGYHRDEQSYRSVDDLIHILIDCVSKGGNLLLNVGPTARGEIDERALDRLAGIGRWMRHHDRSIYGCTQAPDEFIPPQDTRLTYNPKTKRLYIHLFAWPYKHVSLAGAADRVEYAQLLHDASEVKLGMDAWHAQQVATSAKRLDLTLPVIRPNVTVPVIELFLK